MKRLVVILSMLLSCTLTWAQGENVDKNDTPIDLNELIERRYNPEALESGSLISLQFYRYKKTEMYMDEEIYVYLMPELPVYPPLVFKNEKQRKKWNKMVNNIKKTLPLAQKVKRIINETYEVLEMLPDKKSKDAHIKAVEKDIKEQFTPAMKKLTFSQGKLLIKLVDRECNQSSFEIVQAFLGPTRAAFYQVFAWTFGASLKKSYRPEDDDKLVERIVQQIETGQL